MRTIAAFGVATLVWLGWPGVQSAATAAVRVEPAATQPRPVSVRELALFPGRWRGRRVIVEGELYKLPGDRANSASVRDQLICNRVDHLPRGRQGRFCIPFWGVRVQDVPGATRRPDGSWVVEERVRLRGRLRTVPCPGLAARSWRLVG